jgi:uncharacterized protein YraI
MSVKLKLGAAVLFAGLAVPSLAMAQTTAFVATDLNLRVGPGPGFEVITAMPAGQTIMVEGCLEGRNWCQVTFEGQTGWAYAAYLAMETTGERIIIAEAGPRIDVPIVTFDGAAGVATGATVGAIVGGPIGAVAGAAIGAAVAPPEHVVTYVRERPIEPVLLEGEVVVGAALPEVVVLHPIPDYEYHFAYVNQRRVLVDPGTRQVVFILG